MNSENKPNYDIVKLFDKYALRSQYEYKKNYDYKLMISMNIDPKNKIELNNLLWIFKSIPLQVNK